MSQTLQHSMVWVRCICMCVCVCGVSLGTDEFVSLNWFNYTELSAVVIVSALVKVLICLVDFIYLENICWTFLSAYSQTHKGNPTWSHMQNQTEINWWHLRINRSNGTKLGSMHYSLLAETPNHRPLHRLDTTAVTHLWESGVESAGRRSPHKY